MTVTREELPVPSAPEDEHPAPATQPATAVLAGGDAHDDPPSVLVAAVRGICPYLASEDGAWQSLHATRELRCRAVDPPAQPTIAKQRALCLLATHDRCPTWAAARGLADARASSDDAGGASPDPWTIARPTPVMLEPARTRLGPLPTAPVGTGGQALIAGLMVLAFVALVIARTAAPPVDGTGSMSASSAPGASLPAVLPAASATPAVPSATPSPLPTAGPSATPSATPGATPTPTPSPSASQSPVATPSPARTYTVRSGDTLSAIAARFGVTVKAIAKANGISDPRLIHPGQVLVIP